MSIFYNNDTRKSYVERQGENHLWAAKQHHELGNNVAMWVQLFTWAMREDIYGTHWDNLEQRKLI